ERRPIVILSLVLIASPMPALRVAPVLLPVRLPDALPMLPHLRLLALLLLADDRRAGPLRAGSRVDVRGWRRGRAGPMALVGCLAEPPRRVVEEAAVGPGVVDLHDVPVFAGRDEHVASD